MLQKLSEIKGLTTNIAITYDMGLQFDVFTSEGVSTNIGNVGNWPCYKMPITPELRELKKAIDEGKEITSEEILAISVCKDLLTYTEAYSGASWVISGDKLKACIENLKTAIKSLDTNQKSFFAFVDIEDWSQNDIKFFPTIEELNTYFTQAFGSSTYRYQDMDDDSLQEAFDTAKENDWFGVHICDFTPNNED